MVDAQHRSGRGHNQSGHARAGRGHHSPHIHSPRPLDILAQCLHVRPVHSGETLREEGSWEEGDGEELAGSEGRKFAQGAEWVAKSNDVRQVRINYKQVLYNHTLPILLLQYLPSCLRHTERNTSQHMQKKSVSLVEFRDREVQSWIKN